MQSEIGIAHLFSSGRTQQEEEAEDVLLVRRTAQGDQAAFDRLYRRLSNRLNRTAWLVCRDPSDAADIVQEVFLTLWEKAACFDPARGNVFPWLARIARFRAIDRIRSRRRHNALLSDFSAESETLGPPKGDLGADHPADSRDNNRAVCNAVAELPHKMRRALQLVYFDSLTHVQAADQLREPVGTVKSRVRRALRRLGSVRTLARN